MKKLTSLVVLIAIFSFTGCTTADPEPQQQESNLAAKETGLPDQPRPQQSELEKLNELREEILTIIKDKSCSASSGTCKAIAFGAKPCGGPYTYLVYNSGHVNENLLTEKVKAFNLLQAEYNKKAGLGSDCAWVSKPEVTCLNGNCESVK